MGSAQSVWTQSWRVRSVVSLFFPHPWGAVCMDVECLPSYLSWSCTVTGSWQAVIEENDRKMENTYQGWWFVTEPHHLPYREELASLLKTEVSAGLKPTQPGTLKWIYERKTVLISLLLNCPFGDPCLAMHSPKFQKSPWGNTYNNLTSFYTLGRFFIFL